MGWEPRKLKYSFDSIKQYLSNVSLGADPIEAASGHMCGPKCMHWDSMSEERRQKLMKAPWNQTTTR